MGTSTDSAFSLFWAKGQKSEKEFSEPARVVVVLAVLVVVAAVVTRHRGQNVHTGQLVGDVLHSYNMLGY